MEGLKPISVQFPLKGEWMALNTPGTKIPSHGTDAFGQTYAFDFIQVDSSKGYIKFHKKSTLSYALGRVHLTDCYGYGKPIYAPISGIVVESLDGHPERDPVLLLRDLSVARKNAKTFDPEKMSFQEVAGNFVIIEGDEAFALLAHMKRGSIKVKKGDKVKSGDLIGNVGHSGNSTAPHLHFHLMNSPDLITAHGIPCCFEKYELYQNGKWVTIENGIPKTKDLILF
ncbi:MAG: M23 family metallopeptidase [Methanobacterium sp.]